MYIFGCRKALTICITVLGLTCFGPSNLASEFKSFEPGADTDCTTGKFNFDSADEKSAEIAKQGDHWNEENYNNCCAAKTCCQKRT
jgi:hypothetical protein